jgi:hypothetical protein
MIHGIRTDIRRSSVRFFLAAMFCTIIAVRLAADATPCSYNLGIPPLISPVSLTAMGGMTSFSYDDIAVAMLDSPVTQSRACNVDSQSRVCLFAPKYSSSSSCSSLDQGICAQDGETFDYCLVTDEFSQLGLLLAMASTQPAVEAFAK